MAERGKARPWRILQTRRISGPILAIPSQAGRSAPATDSRVGSEARKVGKTASIQGVQFGEFAKQGGEDRWADAGDGRQQE